MSLLFGDRPEARQSLGSLGEAIAASRRGTVRPSVDAESALRLGAVWSCMDLICRLAALPVGQYRKAPDGSPVSVELASILRNPTPDMHMIGWGRQILMSWLGRGNVFGAVAARDRLMYPTQMEILDPRRVTASRRGKDGAIEWKIDGKSLGADLIHWPAFTTPGSSIGLAPLEYAASMVGLGLYAGEFGSQWFRDGAHPSSILKTDKPVDAEQAATIKERFMAAINGREPAVLGAGFSYEQVQISPEQSQFLETISANKADIAGFFLVPPELIGGTSGNSQTYANVEQRSLSYLTYNAGWWVTMLEAFYTSLVPTGDYVKINTGALVKVDLKTQATVEDIRIRGGWGTPDEARAHEEREPLPNGNGTQTLWPPYSTTLPTPDPTGGPAYG